MPTIEEYTAQHANESDLDVVASRLAADGADGATVSRIIKRLRTGDARDYPGYAALYRALHQANPYLAHEMSIRFAEVADLVARDERSDTALDDLFRYYTKELAKRPEDRSAGLPPERPQAEVTL